MTVRVWLVAIAIAGLAGGRAWAAPASGSDGDTITVTDGSDQDNGSDDQSSGSDRTGPSTSSTSTDVGSDARKQDLSGHDLSSTKKTNEFERDRFYVDKVDTPKTQNGTLIQGSFAESSFIYTESGSDYAAGGGSDNQAGSPLSRLYTELRYQSDFRHIDGGIWDARVDARVRLVDQPGLDGTDEEGITSGPKGGTIEELKPQSGLFGGDEYDLRELYIVRNGTRSDVFIGRQYITDLGAVKIDGIRVDYASSKAWTLLGFGGLYPFLGSRSVLTDYVPLAIVEPNGTLQSEGRFTVAGGAGAAYRSPNAYGAFGGVVIKPLEYETPRVYVTSNGYLRLGSTLDIYHYAVIDLVGSNTVNSGLTNLSIGLNYKPTQQLRITANYNQVDTQTLDVQAGAYLNSANTGNSVIDNTTYIQRIATTEARAGIAAGLGDNQRFEISTSLAYRYRPNLTLTSVGDNPPVSVTLDAEQSVELYGSIMDRRSIAGLRIGLDGVYSFGVGDISYGHTNFDTLRFSLAHDIAAGRGEWEAEVSYTETDDNDQGGTPCQLTNPAGLNLIPTCFGASTAGLLSVGGTVYYRLGRDWFGLVSAFITQDAVTTQEFGNAAPVADPTITGFTGFLRIGYRF